MQHRAEHLQMVHFSIDPTDTVDRTSLGSALRKKRKNLPPLSSGKSAKECNLSRAHRSVLSVFVVVGSHQLMVHYTYNVIFYSLGVKVGGLQHLTGGNLSRAHYTHRLHRLHIRMCNLLSLGCQFWRLVNDSSTDQVHNG